MKYIVHLDEKGISPFMRWLEPISAKCYRSGQELVRTSPVCSVV
jgi:hypothetical protein